MSLLEKIGCQFVIPVMRFTDPTLVVLVSRALFKAGYHVQEITLMSEALYPLFFQLKKEMNLTIGAGTVLNSAQAERAIDSGADFLISPGLSPEVSQVAHKHSCPYLPGVMTPTDVMQALRLGHDTLKLFPTDSLGGLDYLKNLRGPFPQVKWMLSGGIKTTDLTLYKSAKVFCVGLGQDLFPQEMVSHAQWDKMTERAQKILSNLGEI